MKELKEIISKIKDIKDANFVPSDDAVLLSATQIFLNKPVVKPNRTTPGTKFKIKDPTAPASDLQKKKLDGMGIEYPEEVNMGEASKLIEENLDKAKPS